MAQSSYTTRSAYTSRLRDSALLACRVQQCSTAVAADAAAAFGFVCSLVDAVHILTHARPIIVRHYLIYMYPAVSYDIYMYNSYQES